MAWGEEAGQEVEGWGRGGEHLPRNLPCPFSRSHIGDIGGG